jgi:hypothetical protein
MFGILVNTLNNKSEEKNNLSLYFFVPFVLVAMAVGFFRMINRQKKLYGSYRIIIASDGITREQLNTPTISLSNIGITEIRKNKNGSFTVKGTMPGQIIFIPPQIENYNELEEALNRIMPINATASKSFLEKYRVLLSLANLSLLVTFYVVQNKIVTAVCGAIVVLYMSYAFYLIQTSKNVDYRTKRSSWIVLLVLFSVIGTMLFKLRLLRV